jgi:phage shock protein A
MTLLQRLTRFVKADVHGLLDSLEDPADIVQQTIRDMEEALAHKEQELSALRTTLQRLTTAQQDLARAAQDIDHNIDLCFEAENDTLARNFLRQRLETAQQARQLSRTLEDVQAQCAACEHTMATQREQLAAVVQQYHLYSATSQPPPGNPHATASAPGMRGITEDAVELAFLEEKRRRAAQTQEKGA